MYLLRERLAWRAAKGSRLRVTLITQFFPPDYAATGQLLYQLVDGLVDRGLELLVLTGMPSYAFNSLHKSPRLEFRPHSVIRRSKASRLWVPFIRGRAINGLFFCFRSFYRLFRASRRNSVVLYTSEPAYLPCMAPLIYFFHEDALYSNSL